MAFGFPAYHSEHLNELLDRQIVKQAIQSVRWKIREESDKSITAAAGMNLWS